MVAGEKRNNPSTNLMSQQPNKVQRQTPVSCLECRRRKIKCDRARICKSCDKKGLDCVYPDTFRSIKISNSKSKEKSKSSRNSSSSSPKQLTAPLKNAYLTEANNNTNRNGEEANYGDHEESITETDVDVHSEITRLRNENKILLARLKAARKNPDASKITDRRLTTNTGNIYSCITKEFLVDDHTLRSYIKVPVTLPQLSNYDHVNLQLYTKIIYQFFNDGELDHYALDKTKLLEKLDAIKNDFESMEFVMLICVISMIILKLHSFLAEEVEMESGISLSDLIETYEQSFKSYKAVTHYSKGLFKLQALILYLESHSEDQAVFNGLALEIFVNFNDSPKYASIAGRAKGFFYIRCLINDFPIPQGYMHFGCENSVPDKSNDGYSHSLERLIQTDMNLCEVINTTLNLRLNFEFSEPFAQRLSKLVESEDDNLQKLYAQRKSNLDEFLDLNYLIHEKLQQVVVLYYCDFKLHCFLKPSNRQLESIFKCLNHFLQILLVGSVKKSGFMASCVSMAMIFFDILKYMDSIVFPEYLVSLSPNFMNMIIEKLSKIALKFQENYRATFNSISSKWKAYKNGDQGFVNDVIKIEHSHQPNIRNPYQLNNHNNLLTSESNPKIGGIDISHLPAGLSPPAILLNPDELKVDLDVIPGLKHVNHVSGSTVTTRKSRTFWKPMGGGVLPLQPSSNQMLYNSIDLFGGIDSNGRALFKATHMMKHKQQSDSNSSSDTSNNNSSVPDSINQRISSISSKSSPSQQSLSLSFTPQYSSSSLPIQNKPSSPRLIQLALAHSEKLPSTLVDNNNTNDTMINNQLDSDASTGLFYASASHGNTNNTTSNMGGTPNFISNGSGSIALTPGGFSQFLETPGYAAFTPGGSDASTSTSVNGSRNGFEF